GADQLQCRVERRDDGSAIDGILLGGDGWISDNGEAKRARCLALAQLHQVVGTEAAPSDQHDRGWGGNLTQLCLLSDVGVITHYASKRFPAKRSVRPDGRAL